MTIDLDARMSEISEAPWDAGQWDETVHSIGGADTALPSNDAAREAAR